jgi:hypothetical protein
MLGGDEVDYNNVSRHIILASKAVRHEPELPNLADPFESANATL